jgi:hypothetical protein
MNKKAVLFLLLAPFLVIALFNHPSLDDYWNANTIITNGRLNAVAYSFHHFSGRYFSTFLMCMLNTLPQGEIWIFKLFPILICMAFVSILYYFIKNSFNSLSGQQALMYALMFTLLHILNMRVLFEGLYWMSATITYQIAILIYLAILTLISSYFKSKSRLKLAGILTLVVCLSGSLESIEPLFLTTLLLIFLKLRRERKTADYPIVIYCLLLNIVCGLFVLFSKGTHSRITIAFADFQPSVSHALIRSFESVSYYYAIWLLSPYNILAVLIIISYRGFPGLSAGQALSRRNSYRPLFLTMFISVFVSILVYFPLLYLESDVPTPRITTVIFMIFCFTVAGILITAADRLNKITKALQQRASKTLLWVAFIASIIFSGNFLKVSKDLFSGKAFRFNREQNRRYDQIRNCQEDTCYVDPIKNWPASIEQVASEKDLSKPFLYWDTYFNKKRIIIKQE